MAAATDAAIKSLLSRIAFSPLAFSANEHPTTPEPERHIRTVSSQGYSRFGNSPNALI
jgi:hypothetical protein